ncbi:phenylalanine--tRNA ligase subunit beta [Mycoplasmopsis felifaucium]|uniref:phenylalanine--tRNA ligase subunit beta n=1 Tax=Mycoplasmopsis felifaucium TaxID=35768 RepID=UPI000482AAD4|nr:phenylalanine--tRNA ligase subunit beta [Mycoplasmopsis felifaucium]
MLISLKELNKLMPSKTLDLSIEKDINNLGYEVESISKFSNVSGIKFAKIIDVKRNPNSKTLHVVTLETAEGIKVIQTTAQNAEKDYFTVIFAVNSKIGDITITNKEMGGIVSEGMMAGYYELGYKSENLPFDPDGIILLDDKKITLDMDPMDYLGLNDYILDITTSANRPDANSYFILAKELAAYYGVDFKWPTYKNLINNNSFKSKFKASKNEAKELSFLECNLKNKKTSLQDILFLAKHNVVAKGIYSIDITNLVLIMTGAPAHAYDSGKIKGKITCENFSGNVEILGGKTVEVNNVLAIKDAEKVISLASVMGCENSCVTDKTDKILFELGVFNSLKVRHASKEIKLDSASSIQGGKGINSFMCYNGMLYLKNKLIQDKQLTSQIINLPKIKKGTAVLQNRRKLAVYANCELKDLKIFKDVEATLQKLGFVFSKNRIVAPTYRTDIENYEDIIEEYFRFYGYSNFKQIMPFLEPFKINHVGNGKNWLRAIGYSEIRTFTLVSKELNKLNPFNFDKSVELQTFVSKEREVVRNSIITSMLESADYNIKRKMTNINFFEMGMINYNNFVYGLVSNVKTFDQMKLDICNFLNTLELEFVPFKDNELIHPNVSAKILFKGNFIGWLGKVHPLISQADLWVAEFMNIEEHKNIQFNSYDSNPLKSVDITFKILKQEAIQSKIDEIKYISECFEIIQIDNYENGEYRNVTLRIVGTDNQIQKINNHFNN